MCRTTSPEEPTDDDGHATDTTSTQPIQTDDELSDVYCQVQVQRQPRPAPLNGNVDRAPPTDALHVVACKDDGCSGSHVPTCSTPLCADPPTIIIPLSRTLNPNVFATTYCEPQFVYYTKADLQPDIWSQRARELLCRRREDAHELRVDDENTRKLRNVLMGGWVLRYPIFLLLGDNEPAPPRSLAPTKLGLSQPTSDCRHLLYEPLREPTPLPYLQPIAPTYLTEITTYCFMYRQPQTLRQ